MADPRLAALAEVLVGHSCKLQRGEKVLIEAFDLPEPTLVCALVKQAAAMGALPMVQWRSNRVLRSVYSHAGEAGLTLMGELDRHVMEQMDAYIGIRGAENSNEFSDVPGPQMKLMQQKVWKPVHLDVRVPKTKWVVLRYPTASMAQSAGMSTEAFEDFYFDVCTADYATMERNQQPLKARMEAAKDIRIVGPGSDLSFSVEGIPVVACAGDRNIPDGEVFTAPVKNSVNGVIQYNAGSLYQGTVFEEIRFEFRDGKIVDADCRGKRAELNSILDADSGARYIGEWAIGCNNRIRRPMLDTLFDEKIGGSLHFTPGNSYESADNGNRSQVHWDLVLIQTPEYGGGEIYFDGELIRQNGRFLPEDLQPINAGLE
ncbi:MAG: aminopeptidase [Planctomycetaceae bacterium]|nr:aminopeptidase [Planctomycetaceae bacterium]